MKKESSGKKSLLWLWITIAVVVLLAGTVAALFASGVFAEKEPEKLQSELYWNVDKEAMTDPETSLSIREPEADGLYHILLAVGGEQVEYTVADKNLVNKIDMLEIMCLKFDAEGAIIDAVPATDVYTLIGDNVFVQNIEGQTYLMNSSQALNGMETTIEIGKNVGFYNVIPARAEVPGRDFVTGQLDELEVMDRVMIYGTDENTPTDVFINYRPYESEVYWRIERQYDAANKCTAREKAEDGYWYVDFLVDTKVETHRTKDQAVINAIDGYGLVNAYCGLVFDVNGDIVDCFNAGYAVRGKVAAASYNVSQLSEDGKTFTLTRLFAGNEAGRTFTGTVGEDTKIYNMTTTAEQQGEYTELQDGDLTCVLTDSMGNCKVIFVTNRYVDSPMYYNVSPKYDSKAKQTTRKPDGGWYTIELAVKGQLRTFRCSDEKVVNQMDSAGTRCFGLKVEGNVIKKYYDPACVAGNWSFASNYFVTSFTDPIISTESTAGVVLNGVLTAECEIYDVSGHSDFKGQVTTIREGDRIIGYKNPQGEVTHVYVLTRYEAGTNLYWNVNRNTNRKRDADGWYVYKMIKMGKTGFVTLKTKDAKLAKQVDTYNPAAMTLRVNSDGVITRVYNSNAFTIGYEHLSGIHAIGYKSDTGKWLLKYRTTGAEANVDMSEVEIYNFSGVYDKAPGERTTLRPGDRIECIRDRLGKMVYAWVYEREYDSNAYWLKDPKSIDAKTGYTTREKAADGYYYFTVAVNGGTKTVKTNDIEIATAVDGTVKNNLCLAFGLKLNGDVIEAVLSAISVKGIYMSGQSYYDVTAINGNTVTLERLKPGSSNTGDKQVINVSKAKIYEVSPYAGDNFGKETKLTIGDRVQTYIGEDSETITYVFVAFHNTHEAGAFSYCEHCGKEVFWEPYTTSVALAYIKDYSYHYYLPADCERELSTGWGATGSDTSYDWVLDLNGHTYRATDSYAFAVRGSSTLTVLDTSKAKTGAITGVGVQVKDKDGNKAKYQSSQAGIFRVLDNGVLNLRGGTYTRTVDREITNLRRGGVVVLEKDTKTGRFGTLNIYDGAKLIDNAMDTPEDLSTTGTQVWRNPQGGAIYNNGGVVNIYGGEISNNGQIHEDFKELEKKAAASVGGNIFQVSGELNIYGGKITNGWARGNGGNIYINGGKLNIAGGEISGGVSMAGTNNIMVAKDKNAEVVLSGGKITGDFTISTGNTLSISGKPEITMGEKMGLLLGNGVKAKVGTMQTGAKIVLSSPGIFTTDFASTAAADAVLAKKYFVGETDLTPFFREGKALACGRKACLKGHTSEAACKAANCKAEMLYYNPWTSKTSLPTSGNYYLTADVTTSEATVTSDNLVLDLNGFSITRNVTAKQITDKVATYAYQAAANTKLTITDTTKTPGTVKVVLPKGADNKVIPTTGTAGILSLATGGKMEIYNGIIDGRELVSGTVADAKTGAFPTSGVICGGGELTINGGTFYGWSHKDGASGGTGSIFGGWSTSVLTVNDGTFYGGKVKVGGMFATNGKIVINGGLFDGNNSADNKAVNAEQPRTQTTHGGLIYMANHANSNLEINGGTFNAPFCNTSGGMIYVDSGSTVAAIKGGTFNLGKAGNGGFIRFRGKSLDITGVTLTGGKANTGDIIAFNSSGTLTIGKNAVIDGGIQVVPVGTTTKVVLKDNAKINEGDNYSLLLESAKLDVSGLNTSAKVYIDSTKLGAALAEADATTIANLVNNKVIVSANENYEVVADGGKLTLKLVGLPSNGNVVLNEDITITEACVMDGDLTLDLNGHNITRTVTEEQIANGDATHLITVSADTKLTITDSSVKSASDVPGTVKVVLPKDGSDTIIPATNSTGIINVATGSEVVIDNGIFDGREMKTSATAAGGIFCGGGKLTINDGIFYGWSNKDGASNGIGSIWGGWSTSVLTVNDGTFYGGKTKQGGMFASTGKIIINDGIFDGNVDADRNVIDSTKPKTEVTHGGLILAQTHNNSYVEINGGTFTSPYTHNSGGIIYVEAGNGVVKITGGTFNLGQATNGGFIRFRGKSLDITGVTLTGGKATTGDIINMNSTGTLTIGKDAVIDGGIELSAAAKLVLKDNVKINAGTNYAIKLGTGTLDISGLNDEAKVHINHTDPTTAFAEAADEATAQKLVDNKIIESADPNYKVIADGKNLTVKVQIQWNQWNAAAAATMYGGAEAENLHLTKLPTQGNWQLTEGVTIDARVTLTGDLNLDLNGQTITRKIKTGAADYGVFKINKTGNGTNLYITDEAATEDPTKTLGTITAELDGITSTSGTGFLFYLDGDATNKGSVVIDNGNFDYQNLITGGSEAAMNVQGNLTINGGVFHSLKKTNGNSALISVRSAGVLTINGGTFYGGQATNGGVIYNNGKMEINGGTFIGGSATYGGIIRINSSGVINGGTFIGASATRGGLISAVNLEITGGLFDGNNNGAGQKVDAAYPVGSAGAHGGLLHATGTVTITGGTFQNGSAANSGGGIYAEPNSTVTITGGTFQNSKGGTTGGNMRCDGTLSISGADIKISGGTATNGNNISFCSAETLTIGQGAVIDGGIETRANETGTKIVLVGNAKVNSADDTKYSLRLANTTVHIGAATNAAAATVGTALTDFVAVYDGSYNVTDVQ